MKFEIHRLSSPIAPYIESLFHYEDFMPDHSIERVVPTGHVFLLFELDGIPRNIFDNITLQANGTFTKVWVSGMHRNHLSISAHPHSEMLVVQFKPFGAHPFFHRPICELNEKVLPAEAFWGKEILMLQEQMAALRATKEKFSLAENWLNSQFDPVRIPPEELLGVVEKLQRESAGKYHEILGSYPKSQKHLIDQFKKYIGLTPKYYQRILRFNEILQHIQRKENISWAQVAYQCGYSDQSHFIKEFKHFSGFNPKEFIEQEFHQDETNFFPLDREG